VTAAASAGTAPRPVPARPKLNVSRKTVQTHLAHVFAKLHIISGARLAAEATRNRG
jgi:hypothetical protein